MVEAASTSLPERRQTPVDHIDPNTWNWRGLWTLYLKEVRRFAKVFTQTIVAPCVTTLLFLAIFMLALGRAVDTVNGVAFAAFLAPGLIMMSIMQNAFANTSSSMVISKVQGNVVDVLMPPLGPLDMTVGYALGGMTRGVIVGCVVAAVIAFFVDLRVHSTGFILFHMIAASLMLSLLGLIGGIWSDKFDHIAAVTNFVIMPLTFLSGTFYSTDRLPDAWRGVSHANPFFFAIDGFRYGFIGQADSNLLVGVIYLTAIDVALIAVAYRMFSTGYKLKA